MTAENVVTEKAVEEVQDNVQDFEETVLPDGRKAVILPLPFDEDNELINFFTSNESLTINLEIEKDKEVVNIVASFTTPKFILGNLVVNEAPLESVEEAIEILKAIENKKATRLPPLDEHPSMVMVSVDTEDGRPVRTYSLRNIVPIVNFIPTLNSDKVSISLIPILELGNFYDVHNTFTFQSLTIQLPDEISTAKLYDQLAIQHSATNKFILDNFIPAKLRNEDCPFYDKYHKVETAIEEAEISTEEVKDDK